MSWPVVELGSVVSFVGGSQPPKSAFKYELEDGYVRLLQIRDYKSDRNLTYVPIDSTKKFCSKDDVMIGRYGPPVFQILRGLEGAYNVALMKAQPSEKVDRNYLFYFLKQEKLFRFIDGLSQRTAGQSGVDMEALKAYPLLLPPLDEQKRIAAILDKADAIRRKRQQAIDLADDFLRSVFLDMFGDPVSNPKGWETKPLKLLCDVKGGGTPSKSNETYWGGDIPWVSPKDMKSLYISSSKDKITSQAIKGSSTKLIDTGSVLMVVRSGVLKHTVPLALTTKPVSINQDMKAFSCRSDLNPHYLLFCLKAFSQFLLGTVRGTTADNLSSDVINNLSVPVPLIEMQEKFASIALKQQSTKIKNQNSNDLSLLSFNSLSQQAFSGEL